MKTTFYVICNARGFVRAVKRGPKANATPSLKTGERAVRVQLEMPDKAFTPDGVPTANVIVPEKALISPPPIPTVTVLPPDQ